MRFRLVASALFVVSGISLLAPVHASALVPRIITGPYVSGWFGYWEEDSVVQALADAGAGAVPDVNIFWWGFDGPSLPLCTLEPDSTCTDDTVAPWTNGHLDGQRRILQAAGIPVLGSIVDETKAGTLSTYLSTDDTRVAFASQIADWAEKAGLDGVDLDLEGFAFSDGKASWPATKPRWVAFIKALGRQLHSRDLILSATVPAGMYPFIESSSRSTDDCGDPLGPVGSPNPGTGYCVYAWKEIVGSVDRLRIMAYDYSWDTPGPIGPAPWADEVVESAILQVGEKNREKIWLGIPQYGRNWVRQKADGSYVTRGDCPAGWVPEGGSVPGRLSPSLERIQFILDREQIAPTWNAEYGEYTFRYWYPYEGRDPQGALVTCDAEREVWYADTRSAEVKADIVDRTKIGGVAVWEFGYVLDGFYSSMAQKIAPPLALKATAKGEVARGQAIKVAGQVKRGTVGVAQAAVTVSWQSRKGTIKDLGTVSTDGTGRFVLKVTPPRTGVLLITASDQGQEASISRDIVVTR